MYWPGAYPLVALLTVAGLLLGGFPVGAQTPTPSPTPRPAATPTSTPIPLPTVTPLPPVSNPDTRFGAVQAIFAPELSQRAGVRWQRLIFPWNEIQPNGPNDFEQGWFSDEQINREIARGVEIVGITLYTPTWAARDPQYEARSVPRNLHLPLDHPQNYWASYIRRLVLKYRGRIDTWVILNEPDVYREPDDFRTFAGTPEDYYLVLKTAYLAARSVNPNVKIVMAGFTYWWDKEARRPLYFQRVLDAIGGDPTARANNWFFDAVDVHTYGNPLNGYNIPMVFRRVMREKGIDKPIWIVESNVLPRDDPHAPPEDTSFRATMDEQASYIIQNMALALAAGVQRYSIYKMTDEAPEVGDQYWGLARNDGTVRPAYVAYQVGVRYFQNVRAAYYYWWGAGIPPTEDEITRLLASNENRYQWPWPAAVNVVVMDKAPQRLTVIWNASPQPVTVHLPAHSRVARIVDKYGKEAPLQARDGYYELTLEPSRNNSDPRDRTLYLVGGSPWIIVEDMTQAITPAPTLTFTPTPTPTMTPTPSATPTLRPGETRTPPPATATPTRTLTPTSTPTLGPTPTATATPPLPPTPTAGLPGMPPPAPTLVTQAVPLPPPQPPATAAGAPAEEAGHQDEAGAP
jgi:hypothetical protein